MVSAATDPIQNLQVIAEDGVTYQMFGGAPARFVSLDGTGVPPVRRILQKIPLEHGVVDKGFRIEHRPMILTLFLEAETTAQGDAYREQLVNIFSGTDDPLSLLITKQGGAQRKIDCYLDGAIDYSMSNRLGASCLATIPLVALDPAFYDPTQRSVGGSLVSLPIQAVIYHAGCTADDWPIIDITGPITSASIQHLALNAIERVDVNGAIPAGETWRFDFRVGHKTVRRTSDDANRLSYITEATRSSFDTLRILSTKAVMAFNPLATAYQQLFFDGSGNTADTFVAIYWYRRYLSL